MYLQDKVVIVTGAGQGLGKELSFQLSNLRAKVALVSRTEADLKKVQSAIVTNGGKAEYFVCDVTDQEQVNQTVKNIEKSFGDVHILVNGAGIWTTDKFETKKPRLIEQAFKVNSIGPIYFTKAVLPLFLRKNNGHILNVISKAGTDVAENKDWPTYTATKWALAGYTKALGYALSETKIKVSGFYPSAFESNIFENAGETEAHNQSWMMRTEDVANSIVYMLDTPEDLQIKSVEIGKI